MKGKAFCHLKKNSNEVDVINLIPQSPIKLKSAAQIALLVLNSLRFQRVSLSLVFVSDLEIKRLNKTYLNHPRVTDVIAFPFFSAKIKKRDKQTILPLGEVVVSPKQAEQYAKKLNVPFSEELIRYICHGILHLKGYTDHSAHAKQLMRKKENLFLSLFKQKQIKNII